jgi:hypothetical protein
MAKKSTLANERYRRNSGVYEVKFKFRIYPGEGDLKARLKAIRETEGVAPYIKRLIREDLIKCEAQFLPGKFVRTEDNLVTLGGDSKKIIVGNVTHHDYMRLCVLLGKEDAGIYVDRAREFLRRKPEATVSASHILSWYAEDERKSVEWIGKAKEVLCYESDV